MRWHRTGRRAAHISEVAIAKRLQRCLHRFNDCLNVSRAVGTKPLDRAVG